MKLIAIIPVYNEEKNIVKVVNKLKKHLNDILIVDDGSRDATLNKLRSTKNIVILCNKENKGKGFAIRKGLQYALSHKYNLVILMDGDGQHNPAEIKNFIKKSKDYDLVVGNRMHNHPNMPFMRYFVNRLDSFIVSRITNFDINDVHCGFRAIKTNLIRKLDLRSNSYEIEVEIILNSAKNKAKIANLDIRCIYSGQKSSINPVIDTYKLMKLILRNVI